MSHPGDRRRARRILFAALVLVLPLIVLGALEAVCRHLETPDAPVPTRAGSVDVLGRAPWVSEHRKNLATYYATYSPGPVIRYFPYSGWVMREYESSTFNVEEDGVRRSSSTGQPISSTTDVVRIYMFGGSTMVGADVPDELTLASQTALELTRLRGDGARPVEVVNFGASAYSSTQELLRLLHEMQRRFVRRGKPDIVVFYDGVNEVWAGVHLGHPGYPDAYDRMRLRFDDLGGFLRLKVREILEARSALARRLLRPAPGSARPDGGPSWDVEKQKSLASQQASIYSENMKVTAAWARDSGFSVLHVLQPVIFVLEGGHAADAALQSSLTSSDPRLASSNVEGYRALRALFAGTPNCLDLSGALDRSDQPLFIDYCHIGPEGNSLVAHRLAREIHERRLDR